MVASKATVKAELIAITMGSESFPTASMNAFEERWINIGINHLMTDEEKLTATLMLRCFTDSPNLDNFAQFDDLLASLYVGQIWGDGEKIFVKFGGGADANVFPIEEVNGEVKAGNAILSLQSNNQDISTRKSSQQKADVPYFKISKTLEFEGKTYKVSFALNIRFKKESEKSKVVAPDKEDYQKIYSDLEDGDLSSISEFVMKPPTGNTLAASASSITLPFFDAFPGVPLPHIEMQVIGFELGSKTLEDGQTIHWVDVEITPETAPRYSRTAKDFVITNPTKIRFPKGKAVAWEFFNSPLMIEKMYNPNVNNQGIKINLSSYNPRLPRTDYPKHLIQLGKARPFDWPNFAEFYGESAPEAQDFKAIAAGSDMQATYINSDEVEFAEYESESESPV